MEKRKTFHGRQVGKKRLLPIVFPLFLFLLIPLNGYGDDTPMPEVVQQNSTRITGVVKDAYGEPVIGANVKVVGTTQGTITDFEGKFSINVSGASAKIKISFIGYKDKEVTAKKGVSLNIVLEEDAQTLGEVQVVAYGVQKKVSITGAISSMKGDDLLKTPEDLYLMYYPGKSPVFLLYNIPVSRERMQQIFMCVVSLHGTMRNR